MAQFPILDQFVDDSEKDQYLLDEAKQEIQQHLDELVITCTVIFQSEKRYFFSGMAAVFSG